MNTSDVLNKAADLIEERGWQNNASESTDREFGWAVSDDSPLCLEGGIMAALGITVDDKWWSVTLNTCPAYRAVQSYLGTVFDLWWFNDDDGRTAEEVIATLRAAAVIEAARENTDAREQVSA